MANLCLVWGLGLGLGLAPGFNRTNPPGEDMQNHLPGVTLTHELRDGKGEIPSLDPLDNEDIRGSAGSSKRKGLGIGGHWS